MNVMELEVIKQVKIAGKKNILRRVSDFMDQQVSISKKYLLNIQTKNRRIGTPFSVISIK